MHSRSVFMYDWTLQLLLCMLCMYVSSARDTFTRTIRRAIVIMFVRLSVRLFVPLGRACIVI